MLGQRHLTKLRYISAYVDQIILFLSDILVTKTTDLE